MTSVEALLVRLKLLLLLWVHTFIAGYPCLHKVVWQLYGSRHWSFQKTKQSGEYTTDWKGNELGNTVVGMIHPGFMIQPSSKRDGARLFVCEKVRIRHPPPLLRTDSLYQSPPIVLSRLSASTILDYYVYCMTKTEVSHSWERSWSTFLRLFDD